MQATLAQPQVTETPTTAATLPIVTYDRATKTVTATVIASFNSEPLIPFIGFSGPFGQQWTVIWTVEVTDGSKVKAFSIEPKSGPAGISVGDPMPTASVSDLQRPVTILVTNVNFAKYDVTLTLSPPDGVSPEVSFSTINKTITIDPSIAVVLDPAG
jgi:hypothetical protein